ncbi:hypothetical protein EDC04DRAFT_3137602 [Pisolithus marmoratus]|nr:hypothetical protein EDC04DRAFT_3137602 [Pisolithus marmoratus]
MYRYFSLPVPVTPPTIAAYKSLRFTSLRIDPACFSSSYAREAAYTDEFWYQWLSSPFKRTFVAAEITKVPSESESGPSDGHSWIGMVTILAPSEHLPATLEPLEKAGLGGKWESYFLVAMWVHPEHRGKGIAKELVKRGLEWARTFTDPKFPCVGGEREKVVVLVVHDYNKSACTLYTKMGFRDLTEVSCEEGYRWMVVKV